MKTNVETRYPWAYGFLRSAVDGALELMRDEYGRDVERKRVYERLKYVVERIDEELKRDG